MTDIEKQVFAKVEECLSRLVRESGHLASFIVDPGSFVVTSARSVGNELTEYSFRTRGRYESEFVARDPEAGDNQETAGSIVLDAAFGLTFDEGGGVRVTPGPCLHPTRWDRPNDPAVQAEDAAAMVTPA